MQTSQLSRISPPLYILSYARVPAVQAELMHDYFVRDLIVNMILSGSDFPILRIYCLVPSDVFLDICRDFYYKEIILNVDIIA